MKELKLVALSNGIHLFEGERDRADIGDIVKRDMTNEVFLQIVSYSIQTKQKSVNVGINNKTYKVTVEELR